MQCSAVPETAGHTDRKTWPLWQPALCSISWLSQSAMHHLAICSLTDGRWSIHYIPVSGGIWSYGGQQVAAGDQIGIDLSDLESDSERETVAEMSSCPSFAYVVAVNVFCSIASTNHQMWEDKKKRIKGMQKKQVYVLFKKERNQIFVPFFSEEKDIWWGRESLQCSLRAKRMELSFSEYLNNFNFDQIYIK